MKPSQPSSKRRHGTWVGLVAVVFVFADLLCTHLYLDRAIEFAASQQPVKTEVGIVLFGDFRGRALGPETLRRVHFAVKMFREETFESILAAGGARPQRGLHGSDLMKDEFIASGVPRTRLFLESKSKDTRSNIDEALNVVRQHGWQRVTLVSSPLHIYRVKEIIRNRRDSLSVFLLAYSYRDCDPSIDGPTLWWQTHYEWGAYVLRKVLPAGVYQRLIRWLRSG